MKDYDRIIVLGSGFSKSFSPQMHSMKDLTCQLFEREDFFRNGANSELKELVEEFKSFKTDTQKIQTIPSASRWCRPKSSWLLLQP